MLSLNVRRAVINFGQRLSPAGLLAVGLAAVVSLALPLQLVYVTLGSNFHTVLLGEVYRSAQPSMAGLEAMFRTHKIRTVLNLRGDNTDDWYYLEHALGERLGVNVVDVGLWAYGPPPPDQFVLLVETLAQAPPGILVHCNSGGDRSGLAGALAILLRSDGTLCQARRQLSFYYGHNPFGKASCQSRVLDCYEEWLTAHAWQHTPQRLRKWARDGYQMEMCQ
jgi:hypothetical protein